MRASQEQKQGILGAERLGHRTTDRFTHWTPAAMAKEAAGIKHVKPNQFQSILIPNKKPSGPPQVSQYTRFSVGFHRTNTFEPWHERLWQNRERLKPVKASPVHSEISFCWMLIRNFFQQHGSQNVKSNRPEPPTRPHRLRSCQASEGFPMSTQTFGGSKLRAMMSAIAPLPQVSRSVTGRWSSLIYFWYLNREEPNDTINQLAL